ncbi:hypothetical protein CEXT_757131 [Caerostris extrusa]|uniref:Uncharacterized protein n=1 Tax=Caerostris extrusa TaxID=172846 RepID=A0AAV4V8C0_CAEEX|nr:hypothetical protein CEXT_757131 [Caerostris extrusa]
MCIWSVQFQRDLLLFRDVCARPADVGGGLIKVLWSLGAEHHPPSFYREATSFQTAFSARTMAASPELLPRATDHLVP